MSKENANHIIKYFCDYLEITPLSFDENNKIELTVDDDLGVVIEYIGEMNSILFNFLVAPINITDTESRNDLLFDILTGNYLWGYTAGGTLGIDSASSILCLSRIVEVLSNSPEECKAFLDLFASLTGAARYWRDYINGVGNTPSESSALPHNFIKI